MTDSRVFPKAFDQAIRGSQLRFGGFRIEGSGTRGLFAHPGFVRMVAKVTDLDLTGNRIGAAGLEAIASSPIAGQIDCLTLTDCAMDADAVAILGRFEALEYLTLDDNPLGTEGARQLAALPCAPRLKEVSVNQCAIGGEGIAALRGALRANCFGAAFAEHGGELGSGGSLMPTVLLSLQGSVLGDAGTEGLAAWGPSPANIALSHTGVDDEGLTRLAAAGFFARAVNVDLRGNPLTAAGLAATTFADGARVATSLALPELRALRGGPTGFTTDRLEDGYVLACPYCREVHDVDQPLCAHCGGDVTRDAGYEEPDDYVARRLEKCAHCGDMGVTKAMRCRSCRSWLPTS